MNRFARVVTFSIAFGSLASAIACGGSRRIDVPENARVDILQTDKMVLRGVADASLDSPNCKNSALPAKHFVELKEDLAGHFLLRPAGVEPAPKLAVLHVTNLESGRTWCVQAATDGVQTAIPGEFPMGTYDVSVTEPRSATAHRYELVVEKL